MKYVILLFTFSYIGIGNAWGALSAPTNLKTVVISQSSIRLEWSDNSLNESGFLIQRSLSSSSGFVGVGSVGKGMTFFAADTGLAANTTYYYRIRAYLKTTSSTTYSSYSNVASGRTASSGSYTYSWLAGSYGSCSATACGTSGTKSRTVSCLRSDNVKVADSYCTVSGAKPATSAACSAPVCSSSQLNVKDFGAIGNGIADDTMAIQKALNAVTATKNTVVIPDGTYLINAIAQSVPNSRKAGLIVGSNLHIVLQPNAILKVKPNSSERYYVMYLNGSHDVTIEGGQLVGDRDKHTYTSGSTHEWGMGIALYGTKNVTVKSITARDLTGDGFVTGGYASGTTFDNVKALNNRRQGLSITRSDNTRVLNSEFANTNGTAPQYGIDIEPDPATGEYYARNILIENNKIHDNKGGGVQAYKQVYGLVLRNNDISFNNYGIYTVETFDSTIVGNNIAHNRNSGFQFNARCDGVDVSGNTFRNNSTSTYGVKDNSAPLTTLTGTGTASSHHIRKAPDAVNMNVLTNKYAN
jgi:nitrous oxidase accessory protein NosD